MAALVYAFLYVPLAVVVAFSFNNARHNVAWRGFTLKWYASLPHNVDLMSALWVSVQVAVCSAGIYGGMLNVPPMLPEVVLGVGLLSFFVWLNDLSDGNVPLSFGTLVVSHVVFALPFVVGSVRARLKSLQDDSYEEAAMDLGCTEWEAFYKITLPLAWPAIFSGAILAFTISFEDFVTSFFVAGPGTVTFPIRVYSMMKTGVTPDINAIATLMLALTLSVLLSHAFLEKEPKDS
jgi:spermidine/putrescine transport system permease protein